MGATEYDMGSNDGRTQHHEITGGKLSRITKNATKLTEVFVVHGNPFTTDEDDMYNLLTRTVMNEKVTKDIFGRDDIGQQMFEGFVTERLTEGNRCVWDPMKRNLSVWDPNKRNLSVWDPMKRNLSVWTQ